METPPQVQEDADDPGTEVTRRLAAELERVGVPGIYAPRVVDVARRMAITPGESGREGSED